MKFHLRAIQIQKNSMSPIPTPPTTVKLDRTWETTTERTVDVTDYPLTTEYGPGRLTFTYQLGEKRTGYVTTGSFSALWLPNVPEPGVTYDVVTYSGSVILS